MLVPLIFTFDIHLLVADSYWLQLSQVQIYKTYNLNFKKHQLVFN